jgi:heme oxygenase
MRRPDCIVARLRSSTATAHIQLEQRLQAVERFCDPVFREDLIRRYAAFHIPAEHALAGLFTGVANLGVDWGSRSASFALAAGNDPLPVFPAPRNLAEAMGMLYVLEGSRLGGRLILRTVSERGGDVSDLQFLDPYGADTGRRWQRFLNVLQRHTEGDETRIEQTCDGAIRAFEHAERVLCGDSA